MEPICITSSNSPLQIFCYLLPCDILNLSRTDKEFRNLLMQRSAIPFWKNARKNVPGLPEPFAEMSEPAYANLCFSPHCHVKNSSPLFVIDCVNCLQQVCLRSNVQDVIWNFRIRLCNDCKRTRFAIVLLTSSSLRWPMFYHSTMSTRTALSCLL